MTGPTAVDDTGRDRLGLVIAAALILAIVVILEAAGTYAFHVEPAMRILCGAIVGGLLAFWAVAAALRPSLRPRTVLAGPLAISVVAFGLSVLGSQRPRLSFEPAIIGVASALMLLMLTSVLRRPSVRRLIGATIMLLAIGIGVGYLVRVSVEWVRWWALVGHLTAPPLRPSFANLSLGSPNLVATFLLLFGPLGSVIAAQRFRARVGAVVLALATVALFLTGSRGGYLGAVAAMAVAVWLSRAGLATRLRAFAVRVAGRDVRSSRRYGVLLAFGAIAATAVVAVGPSLIGRLTLSGADTRGWFWRSAMELFWSSPITGTGPGTWAQLKLANALPDEVNFVVPHAHNVAVQTITEGGVVWGATLLLLAAAFLWRAREVHRRGDRWVRLQVVAVVVGLAGLIGQQVPDYLMNLPAVTLAAGLLIAWMDGLDEAPGEASSPLARLSARLSGPAALVLGAMLVVSLPMLTAVSRAMLVADGANGAANRGDWGAALAGYERALADDPTFTLYRLERANALAHLGRLDEARDVYATAEGEDLLPETLIALAALEVATGDGASAAGHAATALDRGRPSPFLALNAGSVLEASGDPEGAVRAYTAAIRGDLALSASTFWTSPERGVTKDEVIDAVRSAALRDGDVSSAAIISAYAGRIEEARADVATVGASGRGWLAAIVEGIGGDRAAGIAELRTIVDAEPADFATLVWLARLSREAGDPDAGRYAELAFILRYDEAGGNLVSLSVVPAIDAERSLGAVPGYPFAIYSRRGPLDIWPPQVLVIGATAPS